MSVSMQITQCCSRCHGSISECQCKPPYPVFICGTCEKPVNQCKCEPEILLRRCDFCMEFKAIEQHAASGLWVCPACLSNKAVQYSLKHSTEEMK